MSDDMLTRLARVIAAAAIQREIDKQPCPTCGGDPLRPAYNGRAECHAPWPKFCPTCGCDERYPTAAHIIDCGVRRD